MIFLSMKFLPSYSQKRRLARILFTIGLMVCTVWSGESLLSAQPNSDLVPLFDRSSISGTGRSASMAGAFGSVGADLGCLEINPAGLGLYRSSDVCVTPAARIAVNNASYDGANTNGTRPSFEIAQAGFAFTKLYANSTKHGDMSFENHPLRSITFAINFQRDAYFSRVQDFNVASNNNSLVGNYANYATNYGFFPIEMQLLYFGGLINSPNGNNFYSRVNAPVQQLGNIITRGGVDKISLGLGGNLLDKVYFGFSLGIPILNYTTNAQMTESQLSADTGIYDYPSYNLGSEISESGVGFTGNLGIIYRPVPWARFGISYTLPTWYFLTENYSSSLTFYQDTLGSINGYNLSTDNDPLTPINYRIRTPMKGTVSASFYLKEMGFLSVDYEVQNVGATRYRFETIDTTNLPYIPSGIDTFYNSYLKSTYGFIHTIRAGIEGAIKVVRLHAGYSYSTSPFKKDQVFTPGYTEAVQNATCGVGVRLKHFYFDLAYVFSFTKDALQGPNNPTGFQLAFDQVNSRYMSHQLSLTIGWKITNDRSSGKQRRRPAPVQNSTPPPVDPGDRY